eukprot:2345176-Rhodomonas_salina.3
MTRACGGVPRRELSIERSKDSETKQFSYPRDSPIPPPLAIAYKTSLARPKVCPNFQNVSISSKFCSGSRKISNLRVSVTGVKTQAFSKRTLLRLQEQEQVEKDGAERKRKRWRHHIVTGLIEQAAKEAQCSLIGMQRKDAEGPIRVQQREGLLAVN